MTVTTIRPASTQRDGFVRSDGSDYLTARAAYSSGTASNSASPLQAGQRLNAGTYLCWEVPFGFDCSSITSSDTVSAASVELARSGNTQQMLYMRAGDAGSVVGTEDWIAGATLAAATDYGDVDMSSLAVDTPTQFPLNAAGIAAVQAAVTGGGYFTFYLISKNFADGTAPSGDERTAIHSSEQATASYRPALIVTHSSSVSVTVTPTGDTITSSAGSVTATGAAVTVPTGASITSSAGSVTVTGSATVTPTGDGLTLALGNTTEGVITSVPVTGDAISISVGSATVTGSANVQTTGTSISALSGSPGVLGGAIINLTGETLAMSAGDASVAGKARVTPTGNAIAISRGTVVALQATPITFTPTGSSISISVGSVAAGPRNVIVDEASVPPFAPLSISVGTVSVVAGVRATVSVTGVSLSMGLGNELVPVVPRGQSATLSVGSVTVKCGQRVFPTGNALSINSGLVQGIGWGDRSASSSGAWSNKDGGSNSWTAKDGAANSWTERTT